MLGKKDAGIEDAIKGLKAIQMDEEKRHAYLRRQMALMDYNTQIKTAREEGIEKEKEAVARKALALDMSMAEIMTLTGLTLEKIKSIQLQKNKGI